MEEKVLNRSGGPEDSAHICAHSECNDAGVYPAPVSRLGLRSYTWFCLEHVREYNAAWNYCAGMSEQDVEAEIRRDTVWRRPSWPLGTLVGTRAKNRDELRKQAEACGGRNDQAQTAARELRSMTAAERQAFATLGLTPPVGQREIRQRYKILAKSLHPDANGRDSKAEERLKLVNHAYAILRCGYRT